MFSWFCKSSPKVRKPIVRLAKPCLETLDSRLTPSATVTVNPAGTLSIDCDAAKDTVVLYDDGAGGITGFATDNSNNLVNINASGISDIYVNTRDGDDRVAYFLTGDLQTGQRRFMDVRMENGNDVFAAYLHNPLTGIGSKIQADASLVMATFGGAGNDQMTIDASRDVDIGVQGRLKMILFGEGGNDLLRVLYHGENDGSMSCREADGGRGDDIIRVKLTEDAGSTGINACVVHGGAGRDRLFVSLVTKSPPVAGSIVDGGVDLDVAFVSSTFVIPVVNIP